MIYLASEGGAEATSNPLIPDVGEIVITLIGFLILYYIVAKYVVPAFEKIYQDRKEAIEGALPRPRRHRQRLQRLAMSTPSSSKALDWRLRRFVKRHAQRARQSLPTLASVQPLRLSALAIMQQRLSRQSVRQQQCPSVPRLALLLRPLPARLWAKPSTMMSDRPVW